MFSKILIANRGEIAVRIIKTCRRMGIATVQVYSEADAGSLAVEMADEAVLIGPAPAAQSYLLADRIVEAVRQTGAEAVHPGFGFLSENAGFARRLRDEGIAFIGPNPEAIEAMGDKISSKKLAAAAGVSTVPGHMGLIETTEQAVTIANGIGYPVMIKASAGGGGKGIRVAHSDADMAEGFAAVKAEALGAFGDDRVFLEKFIIDPRHIEIQVLGDKHGNVVHLGDRDCSIQRRFQKLIEEAPCPIMTPFLRMKMGAAALDVAMILQYVNALTVEFFYFPETQKFYFNEINSRLQVEHCVTELATGIDIVKEQIRIAAGEPLNYSQDDIRMERRALECRITAEDATRNFIPSPGVIKRLRLPHGLGTRIDEGIYDGYTVPFYYDPLLLKLMTWGKTREETLARMRRALDEMRIEGIRTSAPFHRIVMDDADFISGKYTTALTAKPEIQQKLKALAPRKAPA